MVGFLVTIWDLVLRIKSCKKIVALIKGYNFCFLHDLIACTRSALLAIAIADRLAQLDVDKWQQKTTDIWTYRAAKRLISFWQTPPPLTSENKKKNCVTDALLQPLCYNHYVTAALLQLHTRSFWHQHQHIWQLMLHILTSQLKADISRLMHHYLPYSDLQFTMEPLWCDIIMMMEKEQGNREWDCKGIQYSIVHVMV